VSSYVVQILTAFASAPLRDSRLGARDSEVMSSPPNRISILEQRTTPQRLRIELCVYRAKGLFLTLLQELIYFRWTVSEFLVLFKMSQLPLSPPSEPGSPRPIQPVPLTSSIRTTPIHPLLSDIRVPGEPLPSHRYHPVTCTPIDIDDVRSQLEQLRKEYPSSKAALKAQEEIAKEVRQRLDEAEKKREEVQKALDKKTQERDIELKVVSKYQKMKASEIPS